MPGMFVHPDEIRTACSSNGFDYISIFNSIDKSNKVNGTVMILNCIDKLSKCNVRVVCIWMLGTNENFFVFSYFLKLTQIERDRNRRAVKF